MNENYLQGISSIIKNGFWFVDIPRTSSSSIRAELGRRFGNAYGKSNLIDKRFSTEQIFPDHMTAIEMFNLLGEHTWDKIFSFSIVRNPWDRVFSMFNYRKTKGNIPLEWTFTEYLEKLKEATAESKYFSYHGFRFGASDFIMNNNDEVIVKFIVRFENRDKDLEKLSNMMGIRIFGNYNIQNTSLKNKHYSKYYDKETKEIIELLYAKDIEHFNYHFEYF